MTDTSVLQSLFDRASQAGDEVPPTALMTWLSQRSEPLLALADSDDCNAAVDNLVEEFPNLHLVAHNNAHRAVDDRLVGLARWLIANLRDWNRSNDARHERLVTMLVVVLAFGRCDEVWKALPDAIGNNTELMASLEAAILWSRCALAARDDAPIWEQESVVALTSADKARDWGTISRLWPQFETAMPYNAFLAVAARGLIRFNEAGLIRATRDHGRTVDCMLLANALNVNELPRIARGSTNAHVQFCFVLAALRLMPRNHRFVPRALDDLAAILQTVASDETAWLRWMQVFARFAAVYPALSAPLGAALVEVSPAAVSHFVNSVDLSIGHATGRGVITDILRHFRERASPARRQLLWCLAFERWDAWRFAKDDPKASFSEIQRSELDFAVVGHCIEALSESERQEKVRVSTANVMAVDAAWHASREAWTTAWFRELSYMQLLAHAGYAVASGGDWLATKELHLPIDPTDAFTRLRRGAINARPAGAKLA